MPYFKQEEAGVAGYTQKTKVPLAGDLMGRKRVTGAKRVRMGCDQPEERYENIVETPALWHAKQAFLKVTLLRSIWYLDPHLVPIDPTDALHHAELMHFN